MAIYDRERYTCTPEVLGGAGARRAQTPQLTGDDNTLAPRSVPRSDPAMSHIPVQSFRELGGPAVARQQSPVLGVEAYTRQPQNGARGHSIASAPR